MNRSINGIAHQSSVESEAPRALRDEVRRSAANHNRSLTPTSTAIVDANGQPMGIACDEPFVVEQFAGLNPLPENMLSHSVKRRAWNGVSVSVSDIHCAGRVSHHLLHEDQTRLSVLLDEVGSHCEPRLRENEPCPIGYIPRHMHFAPAGMEVWGYSAYIRFVRDATLTFDLGVLSQRLATTLRSDVVSSPRIRFADDHIWTLVRLLSEVLDDPDPSTQLYGDGLTAAIAARLFAEPSQTSIAAKGLSPWQLRRVIEYLEAHLPNRVDLADLATLTGLSQSHFSHAFKASTGMAPYRWQLDARIRRAQALLMDTHLSLDDIAEATGFADAVHFGRTFRKLIGATPAAWRNERKQ